MGINCPNKQRNLAFCNCSYPGCEKKGVCCECLAYHRNKGQIPACYFPPDAEKTYNRSLSAFIRTYQAKPDA